MDAHITGSKNKTLVRNLECPPQPNEDVKDWRVLDILIFNL